MSTNCSDVPATTASNAGIAGAGVLLSFIITAGIALLISASLILHDTWQSTNQRRLQHREEQQLARSGFGAVEDAATATSDTTPGSRQRSRPRPRPPVSVVVTTIGRKMLNGYSDQQIMTGIGIQCVGLTRVGTIVPYHFFLIWMLGLLSTAVHNAALLALVHDFRRDWVLRWLRQALMFANLVLSCVCGVYVLRGLARDLPATLPMSCVWAAAAAATATANANANATASGTDAAPPATKAAGGFQYVATVAVIAGNLAVFGLATWYLHNRAQRFYRIVQLIGMLLMGAVAIGVTVRVLLLSQAFGSPSVALSDDGEVQWSFGQLLSLLMLLLPLISAFEIARGEIKVAPPVCDDGDADTSPLINNADQLPMHQRRVRSSFNPSPFFAALRAPAGASRK